MDPPLFGEVPGKAPRRVKVYLLQGEDWLDHGTGYCRGAVDAARRPYFLVVSELDSDEIILKLFLEGCVQYQRQQETLIVWTDALGRDLALLFQETEACADLCDFIVRVQQEGYAPDISLYYVLPGEPEVAGGAAADVTELITGPVALPPPPLRANIHQVLDLLRQGTNSHYTRSRILRHVRQHALVDALIAEFGAAERDHDLGWLHCACECVKTLVLYTEPALLEHLVALEARVVGVAGILEYDQEFAGLKAAHRRYLCDELRLRTVVAMLPAATRIFRLDFCVTYLRDVVLARFIDDQTYGVLSGILGANHSEMIGVLGEEGFLERLFGMYAAGGDAEGGSTGTDTASASDSISEGVAQSVTKNGSASGDLRRDGVRLLHQYVLIAKTLPLPQRLAFFSALVRHGLFKMAAFALRDGDAAVRTLGTELIVVIIEQDVALVNTVSEIDNLDPPAARPAGGPAVDDPERTHLKLSDDMTLIEILARLLVEDRDRGLKMQSFEALRILLDLKTAALSPNAEYEIDHLEDLGRGSSDFAGVNTSNYFEAFYAKVAPELFALLGLPPPPPPPPDTPLLQHLCDLVAFCIKEHEPAIAKPFFLGSAVLAGMARLIDHSAVKTTAKLAAIRCLKAVISLDDADYLDYIIDRDIFGHVMRLLASVIDENNMANSACLDLLEAVMHHQGSAAFKRLAHSIHTGYRPVLDSIDHVTTGEDFVRMVEQQEQEQEMEVKGEAEVEAEAHTAQSSEPAAPAEATEPAETGETLKRRLEDAAGGHLKKSA